MSNVVIIGGGIVGAAIAYELSLVSQWKITLIDSAIPTSGATGAALGVLMGIISQKTQGRAWKLRKTSIERYQTLIPELESLTGKQIPYNRQGILRLCWAEEDLGKWQKLISTRHQQGWQLEIWNQSQLQRNCPQLGQDNLVAAIYSPQDGQVQPTILTETLLTAAQIKGVQCNFGELVNQFIVKANNNGLKQCSHVCTQNREMAIDWLIIAAGNGSTSLTTSLQEKVDIRPVLGQALHLQLESPLGNPDFQPVITGNDVHIIPLGKEGYWLGATVEFANDRGEIRADADLLEAMKQQAISFCPALADATIIRSWSGKRPRPQGRSAPIIEKLTGYSNVLLATGHYRNGVLLAPATALAIRELLISHG